MMERVRFVLVGCGRIASKHVAGLQAHAKHVELVAVCDPVMERAQALAQSVSPKCQAFGSLEDMVQHVEADCALLATPSGLHGAQTLVVARAGLHVVSEKPMALSLEDADRMLNACQAAGTRLFVIKQLRVSYAVRRLAELVHSGVFGKLYLGQVNVFWTRPQAYFDEASWRGTKVMDGGCFFNQASHHIDLLHWLFGDAVDVHCEMDTLQRTIETEDTGAAVVRFASGAMATINVTMLTYDRNLETSLTILGERGTVRLSGGGLETIEEWRVDGVDEPEPLADIPSNYGHAAYFGQVLRSLRGESATVVEGSDARASLSLLHQLYSSAGMLNRSFL